ncbi:hypothetical protein EV401DRAFT_1978407 [Pisolithus croceorrhizus]|nr:hypothetical protein EV401DRAFT_1978407 [Pisolithus croceorrhizus]
MECCDRRGCREITEGWTVAPTPDILSFYMVFMSHYIQSRSVENYLTGIVSQLQPHFLEVRETHDSILVYCTLHGFFLSCLLLAAAPLSCQSSSCAPFVSTAILLR